MKRNLFFSAVMCLFLSLSGCGNGNLFSWTHDKGEGDYESLMTDAQAAMKDKNYADAVKYYRKALSKKPKKAAAIFGYSSALFAEASGSSYEKIIQAVLDKNDYGSAGLLSFLEIREAEKMRIALNEILAPGMLPSILDSAENKVDANLNAAISYLLFAAVSIITDASVNINDLNINGDFSFTAPEYIAAALAIKQAVEGYIIPALLGARKALENISADGGSISDQLREKVNGLIRNLQDKGYPL